MVTLWRLAKHSAILGMPHCHVTADTALPWTHVAELLLSVRRTALCARYVVAMLTWPPRCALPQWGKRASMEIPAPSSR